MISPAQMRRSPPTPLPPPGPGGTMLAKGFSYRTMLKLDFIPILICRKQNVSKFEALKKLKEARKEGRKMNYEIEEVLGHC